MVLNKVGFETVAAITAVSSQACNSPSENTAKEICPTTATQEMSHRNVMMHSTSDFVQL